MLKKSITQLITLLILIISINVQATLPEGMTDAEYQTIVTQVMAEQGYFDAVAVEDAIGDWLLNQGVPNVDGDLVDSGSCNPCSADGQSTSSASSSDKASGPVFHQPRNIKVKAKKNPDGTFKSVVKVKWKRPKKLDASLDYVLDHYLVYISKNNQSYEIFKKKAKFKRNGKPKKKQSLKFKNRGTADYSVQVQAVYVPTDERSSSNDKSVNTLSSANKSSAQGSAWPPATNFTVIKEPTQVMHLTGAIKTCLNDNGHADSKNLLHIQKDLYCIGYNLQDSDISQMSLLQRVMAIDITNNPSVTNIGPLSELNYLFFLNISQNPSIVNSDYSIFEEVRYLRMQNMGLNVLPDLSNNDNLKYLDLTDNNIANGFEQLPAGVDTLVLDNNELEGCTGLAGKEVETISLAGDKVLNTNGCSDIVGLKNLDITNAPNLTGELNIDNVTTGYCSLTLNNTGITSIRGRRLIHLLRLTHNAQLKNADVISGPIFDDSVPNPPPSFIPFDVELTGSNNMLCSNVYDKKNDWDGNLPTDMTQSYDVLFRDDSGLVIKKSPTCPVYRFPNAYRAPTACEPSAIQDFEVSKDNSSNSYTLNWSRNNHQLWGVKHYNIRVQSANDILRTVPISFQTPLVIPTTSQTTVNFEIQACTDADNLHCGEWVSTQTLNGLGQVTDVSAVFNENANNNTFQIGFTYPTDFEAPSYFKIETYALQPNGTTLIGTLNYNSQQVQFYSSAIDNDDYFGNTYLVFACDMNDNCGEPAAVTVENPATMSDEITEPTMVSLSCDSEDAEISFTMWENLPNDPNQDHITIDYFKISEEQPVAHVNRAPTQSGGIRQTYYIEATNVLSNNNTVSISDQVRLKRIVNGRYSFSASACIRDRENGDVCGPAIQSSCQIQRTQSTLLSSPQINSVDTNLDIKWAQLSCGSESGCNNINEPLNGSAGHKRKALHWTYNGADEPDYFYVSRETLSGNGENTEVQNNSCIATQKPLYGDTGPDIDYGKYKFSHNSIDVQTHNGTNFWTTLKNCDKGIWDNESDYSVWKIQACFAGIGCSEGNTVDLSDYTQKIDLPSGMNNNEFFSTGPEDLIPGLWWNPHQSGTGWYFYWANNAEPDGRDEYGNTFDLLAYWVTYKELNGVWTPVWLHSRMKLVQDDENHQFFEGYVNYNRVYTNAQGITRVEENSAGIIQVLMEDANPGAPNRKATIKLNLDFDSDIFTQDQINFDHPAVDDQYEIIYNADGTMEIPIEIASSRLVGGTRFGNEDDDDHYQGVWRHESDNHKEEVTTLLWKKRKLEVMNHFIYDNNGEPLWLQSQNCTATTCETPQASYFDGYINENGVFDSSAHNVFTIADGFNPIGYTPTLSPFALGHVKMAAKTGRTLSNDSLIGDDKYKQALFWLDINVPDGNESHNIHRTVGLSLGSSNNPVTMQKIANIHRIGYKLLNQFGEVIYTDASQQNLATQCRLQDAYNHQCRVRFNWYSDFGYQNIIPYYINNSNGETGLLSDICTGVPVNTDVVNSYICDLAIDGNFTFELRKPSYDINNNNMITIAQSESLDVVPCEGSCKPAQQINYRYAEVPEPAQHTLSSSSTSSTVGLTTGSFSVDASGSAAYTMPIYAPMGTGGLSPDLYLSYNSADTNNSVAGVGWSIGGITSITRCLKNVEQDGISIEEHKPITLNNEDAFCLNGQKLKHVPGTGINGEDGAEYRTELESFTKIVVDGTQEGGPKKFKAYLKNGEIRVYGSPNTSFNAQIKADGSNTVITWLLNKIEDRHGNSIWYVWDNDNASGETLIKRVEYTRRSGDDVYQNQIAFNYQDRNDQRMTYSLHRQQQSLKRLSSITTKRRSTKASPFETIRQLKLGYQYSPLSGRSQLISIRQCANALSSSCLKPVEFNWSSESSDKGFSEKQESGGIMSFNKITSYKMIDLNGDSKKEIIFARQDIDNSTNPEIRFYTAGNSSHINLTSNNGETCVTSGGYFNSSCNTDIQPAEPEDFDITTNDYFAYDFNGDGKEDLLSPVKVQGQNLSHWTISYSNGSKLCQQSSDGAGCIDQLNTNIEWKEGVNGATFSDFTADGLPDLMRFDISTSNVQGLFNNYEYSYSNYYGTGNVYISHLNNNNSSIAMNNSNMVALTIDTSETPLGRGDIYCVGDSSQPVGYEFMPCQEVQTNIDGQSPLDLPSMTEITAISHLPNDFNNDGLSDVLIGYRHLFHDFACQGGNNRNGDNSVSGGDAPEGYPLELSGCWVQWWAVHTYEPTGVGTAQLKHLKTIGLSRGVAMDDAFISTDGGVTVSVYNNPELDFDSDISIQVMDANADGLADVVTDEGVMFNNGQGFNTVVSFRRFEDTDYVHDDGYTSLDRRNDAIVLSQFIDYDNDGDLDVLYPGPETSDSYVRYRLRTLEYNQTQGYYYSDKQDTSIIARNKDASAYTVIHTIDDFNGDSYQDHLYIKLSNGDGTQGDEKHTEFGKNAWKAREKINKISSTGQNGLKNETVITYESATMPSVYTRQFDGFGQYWHNGSFVFDVSAPAMYLVRQVQQLSPTKANADFMASMFYHFKGLKAQGGGRGSLGFAEMSTVDVQNNISNQTSYRQDFPFIGSPVLTMKSHHNSLNSVAANSYTCVAGVADCSYTLCTDNNCQDPLIKGTVFDPLTDAVNQYEEVFPASLADTHFVYIDKTVEDHFDLNANTPIKTLITEMNYYNENNSAQFYGDVKNTSNKVCSAYTNNVCEVVTSTSVSNIYDTSAGFINNWMLGRLSSATTTKSRLDEVPGSPTNGQLISVINTSNFTYDTNTGQLESESVGSGVNQYIKTIHIHDTYGNETDTLVCSKNVVDNNNCNVSYNSPAMQPNNVDIFRHTKTAYDTQWYLYPDKTYALFGTQGNAATLVQTTQVQSRDVFGNVLEATDMLNNITTESVYGLFGEPQASKNNTGVMTQVQNRWCNASNCPDNAMMYTESVTAGAPTSREYKDAQGRVVRTQTQSMGTVVNRGAWKTVDSWYDDSSRAQSVTIPYFISMQGVDLTPSHIATTSYDDLSRVIATSTPNHAGTASTLTNYDGLTLTSFNAKNQKTVTTYDASGKVIQLDQFLDDHNVDYSTIEYYYGAHDELIQMDFNGETTTMDYDSLGRKLSMNDPDKGSWNYRYNALNEMITQTDALGQTITYYHDSQGRVVQKIGGSLIGEQNLVSKWYFDENANYSKLTRQSNLTHAPTASEDWTEKTEKFMTYDQFGRSATYTTRIWDGDNGNNYVDYTESHTYDEFSRTFQNIDATGYGTMHLYDDYGYQYKTLEAAACEDELTYTCEAYGPHAYRLYYEAVNMDPFDNITKDQFHKGSLTTIRVYDEKDGIMDSTCIDNAPTDNCSGNEQDKMIFSFDKLGNLTGKNSQSGLESFTYDELNRLKSATRTIGNNSETIAYGYDVNGNLEMKGNDVLSYSNVNAGPHAVTGFKGTSFVYDGVGNMISSQSGQFQRSIEYTGLHKAYKITNHNNNKTNAFIYNADHKRVVRKDSDANMRTRVTHYIGNVEMIKSTAEGNVETYKRYIGSLVIDMPSKTALQSTWKYQYQLKDHLGTTSTYITLDTSGNDNDFEKMSFDTWGQRRWANNFNESDINLGDIQFNGLIDKTTRGYTGHEHLDETGIIHMNGRIYSAYLGRFLQADPIIQDPFDAQSLNRYTYVSNNPHSFNDPSGYSSVAAFMNSIGRPLIGVAVTFITANPEIGLHVVAAGALGGAITGGARGAVTGAFSAYITQGIGHGAGNAGWVKDKFLNRAFAHGIVAGVFNELNGGKFGRGFATSFLSSGADYLGLKNLGEGFTRVLANAIVAGTISEVTGGKFANAALTAGFRVALNEVRRTGRPKSIIERAKALGRIAYGDPRKLISYPKDDIIKIINHLSTLAEAQGDSFWDLNDEESAYWNPEREMLARVVLGHSDKYTVAWFWHENLEASKVNKMNGGRVSSQTYLDNTAKAHKEVLIHQGDDIQPFEGQANRYHPLVNAKYRDFFRWGHEE